MTTVLITRPQPDADALADILRKKGATAIVDPLFAVQYTDAPPQDLNYQAIIVTSRNAIRALVASGGGDALKTLPLLAVGSETETAAREAGFAATQRADQSAASLQSLVMEKCRPEAGPLLYLAGVHRKAETEDVLRAQGFDVRVWEGYDMRSSAALKGDTVSALVAGTIDTVLLFSERAALHFLKLTRHLPRQAVSGPSYFCLSEQVAAPLAQKGLDVHVADQAVLHALVDTLDHKNH